MKFSSSMLTLAAVAAIAAAAPASAQSGAGDPGHGGRGGGSRGGGGNPTSVPEPTDAVLLLMGAVGVVVGRRMHARAQKKR
jgi:hypothetical protein